MSSSEFMRISLDTYMYYKEKAPMDIWDRIEVDQPYLFFDRHVDGTQFTLRMVYGNNLITYKTFYNRKKTFICSLV